MEVALVADSHVPERAESVPTPFVERLEGADHVVHAGDFTSADALARVRELADGLTAVHGNMDPRDLGLPAVDAVELGGVTFLLTHGTGPPDRYEERVADVVRAEAGADAVGVAGHTHEVLDAVVEGVRLLNPGSVTGAPPADRATMMTVDTGNGSLDVTVHDPDG